MSVLLVDDAAYAKLMATLLTDRYRHRVHYADGPDSAVGHLRRHTYDVLVVDVLFGPEMTRFDQRFREGRVSPVDGPFPQSCLSVLGEAARSGRAGSSVIWTEGDDKRLLHMRFAQERLGVRVFADKNQDGDAVPMLHDAITKAARDEPSVDRRLQEEGIRADNRYTTSVADSLFTPGARAAVWRALALGAKSYQDIRRAIGLLMDKTQFSHLADRMATDADNLNVISEVRGREKLAFLTAFAERHRRFLLDRFIKAHFD